MFALKQIVRFVLNEYDNLHLKNQIGTVIAIEDNRYLIQFNENVGGHDGQGRGINGHCWWCPKQCLVLENKYLRIN